MNEDKKALHVSSEYDDIYSEIRTVLATARKNVSSAVNAAMVYAYWEVGKNIAKEIGDRADYGKHLFLQLSKRLTEDFGRGFEVRELRRMRQFYQAFPIRDAVRPELSWTHYRLLMRVTNETRRMFYMNEAADEGWSSRQLDRQINTSYYDRLLATQSKEGKELVKAEIQTTQPITKADDVLKDPYVLEFLNIKPGEHVFESNLEQALINKLQDFLLEMGKGFAFVARQKHIAVDTQHFYVDLVFYNFVLKCFVLVDLKTGELTHQDIGQMDFYVRLFQDKYCGENDNPPIGIVMCAKKNQTVAKYSVLSDKENLFASQYLTYLPTEEELANMLNQEQELLEIEALVESERL